MRQLPEPHQKALASLTAAALVVFLCAGVSAQDLRVSVTNTTTVEARTDNGNNLEDDDNYGVLVDRLNLSASAGGLTAQTRLDGFVFVDAPSDAYRDDLIIERITARYRIGDFTVTAGDFYKQLGRGIVLSIRKIDEELVDVSVQGGQVEYADDERSMSLFAGRTNPANLDAVSQKFVKDTNDVLLGGSLQLTDLDPVRIGLFAVYLTPSEKILGERSESMSGGMSMELPGVTDWLSVYVEGDVQQRETLGIEEQGYAVYGTVDLYFGALTFLLEGLYLDGFEQRGSQNTVLGQSFTYNQPPTLDRNDQEIANNRDVEGGRLRVEYYFEEQDLLLFGNGTFRRNSPGEAETDVWHGYGGAELFYQEGRSRVTASGGYRQEARDDDPFKTIGHGELDYLQWLTGKFSFHLQVLHESRTQEEDPWERGSTIASLEWAGVGSLTFEFGYDTQNPSDDVRQLFYSGVLTWEATREVELRVLGGTRRGGIRCIAGVCRNFPAFAGVQGKVIVRY